MKYKQLFLGLGIWFFFQYEVQADGRKTVSEMMRGIPNSEWKAANRYITGGNKTYIIGNQDGTFPDFGVHVTDELGGIWHQKIKLLDGYWARISEDGQNFHWLDKVSEFVTYPYGNEFVFSNICGGVKVKNMQFCPQDKNCVFLTYKLINTSSERKKLVFDFAVKTDLLPAWSVNEPNGEDKVTWDENLSAFKASDVKSPWSVVWGAVEKRASAHQIDINLPVQTKGIGCSAASSYEVVLKPGKSTELTFVVAGSSKDMQETLSTFNEVKGKRDVLLQEKKDYYARIIKRGRITIPDKMLQNAYNWTKVNTEWLVQDLEGTGRFLGAGAIEYPWLFGCDNCYALQGVVASGDFVLAEQTLQLIYEKSKEANGNGRFIHEMGFNGKVANPGNIQETPHFIIAAWYIFHWTGNKTLLDEMYPYMKKSIDFLFNEADGNKNMFPEGQGIMEVRGLTAELIDTSVYTQKALEVMSDISQLMGEIDLSEQYALQAKELKRRINDLFWDEEQGLYCDFYATREEALQVAQGAIEHVGERNAAEVLSIRDYIKAQPEKTSRGWLTNKNWVISTPMEMGIAPRERAIRQLDIVRNEHCGKYGPPLQAVWKKDRMTIAGSVLAWAECEYGRIDESLWYVNRMAETLGMMQPGAIAEVMPDYGCPVQAWTMYGMITPLIRYIYGIQPRAYDRKIVLSPNLPKDWNEIEIENLPIGDNLIKYYRVEKVDGKLKVTLDLAKKDWHCEVNSPNMPVGEFILNGKLINQNIYTYHEE